MTLISSHLDRQITALLSFGFLLGSCLAFHILHAVFLQLGCALAIGDGEDLLLVAEDDGQQELRRSRGYFFAAASRLSPGDDLFRFQTNGYSRLHRFFLTLFFRCQCTDGEANQQRLYDAGVQQTPAVQGNSKRKKRLRFQSKAAEAGASPSQRTRRAVLRSCREMLVREWCKLGSAIRRAAAVCLAPSTGADEDELDLPYVQLDKVTCRGVRREAFGPLYLVT
ncbi:hypothetical protein BDA96_01G512700 [Sorghum bicolor]|jgi:hypothetical protein|uniref:Uncharacterized protein n=2 Tax=Sorghum bicolor TaxID=4558 RepID=A0A921S5K4_SORBI|nr:hypothetical protein SORBI_3001G481000 [Sorghum bicolor]KAG0552503.1 hypothetical protein BDA96_01G512700 [Sorghum bicolor]